MSEKIKIFEVGVEDVDDSLKALWLGLAREMFEIEHLTVPSEANGDKWIELVRDGLSRNRNFLLLAKSGSELVGFALATVFRDYPFEVSMLFAGLNDLYVLPEYRGTGIGKNLLDHCLDKMRGEGIKAVRTRVLSENRTAMKLYEKIGFRIDSYGMVKLVT